MNEQGTCASCGMAILWIRTEKGKLMPCNPKLITFIPGGGPETFITRQGKLERGRRSRESETVGYISHFATCPFANRHRKRNKEGDANGTT